MKLRTGTSAVVGGRVASADLYDAEKQAKPDDGAKFLYAFKKASAKRADCFRDAAGAGAGCPY